MKKGIIGEVLRDGMADFADGLFNNPWLDRFCWGVIILAALYFGPVCIGVLLR